MKKKFAKQYNNEYLLFIAGIAITLFNTVNLQQNTVLLLSVPQYLLVFYYILKKHYRIAFLLHAIFVTACVSGGIAIEDGVSPFLYIKCRVYGPLTFNIIVLVSLWLAVQGKSLKVSKDSLLLKVRKAILYLLASGVIVGFFGCLFVRNNDWHYWITRILFVGEFFLFVDIFARLYNARFSNLIAKAVICMMAASPVASVVSFSIFGVQAFYGNSPMPFVNPIISICPCLIIAFFQLKSIKLKFISLIGMAFYVLHLLVLSRGSQFLDIFVALILLGYLVYFKKSQNFQIRGLRLLLPFFIVIVVPIAVSGIVSSSDVSLSKFEQFTSLFNIFDFSSNSFQFDDIGSSPYIRIGELSNIIYEGTHNLFYFLFGKGYGGFYTDSLHFFDGIDLSRGAFSDESAASGRFYNAHSAIPSVLHYNGLIGLFLMIKIAFDYLRRVDKTFLVFAAFVLFIQTFYFDMYGCFSICMALFGAEYLINSSSKGMTL